MTTLPPLLIINGAAASGKSTIAPILCHRLKLPLLGKDAIKEAMADVLGAANRSESQQLGNASFAIINALAHQFLEIGTGAAVEAPFYGATAEALRPLIARSHSAIVQCDVDLAVILDRIRSRTPARHWVHFDHATPDDNQSDAPRGQDLAAAIPPAFGIPVLHVDTTDGYRPSLDTITSWVRRQLGLGS